MSDKIENVVRTREIYNFYFDRYESVPVQGIVTMDGHITVAVSLDARQQYTRFSFDDFICIVDVVSLRYKKRLDTFHIKLDFPEFVCYFKDVFQFNWYTYFVTIQKKNLKSTNYVSKLISLNQNDTNFDSYTDIILSCIFDDIEYNLIQKAVLIDAPSSFGILNNDRIFVGAFSRGNDPTNPTGNTAICVSKISDIFQDILNAKESFESLAKGKHASFCAKLISSGFMEYFKLLCGSGNYSHKMTATYLHQTKTGHVSALDGTSIGRDYIVLIAGLSTGSLIQITMKSLKSPMELFSTTEVKTPIHKVHIQDEDTIYVLGSHHVNLIFYFSIFNLNMSCNV
ncbi:uncharacterized protein LOC132745989 [Ruditapes philippinarum]|uniref:uncharacterized protein LOC132745989 n=1 Tax=Ruditapes philippinarum TaxID=129788 RepID=UPI00295BAE06|nr:uncharacterized protein LOC132745989 [Ruditapes philippinarum]